MAKFNEEINVLVKELVKDLKAEARLVYKAKKEQEREGKLSKFSSLNAGNILMEALENRSHAYKMKYNKPNRHIKELVASFIVKRHRFNKGEFDIKVYREAHAIVFDVCKHHEVDPDKAFFVFGDPDNPNTREEVLQKAIKYIEDEV